MPRARSDPARATAALILLFLVLLPAVTTRLSASDEIEYFAWLRSLAFDRDVDFENEYRHFHEQGATSHPAFRETFLERVNENGRRYNFAPMGTAVLWAPFYLIAHVAAGALGYPQDGYSRPYIVAVTYGSACYGLLALLIAHGIARRVLGRATLAPLFVWLGTPLLFYMYVAPGFSHAASAFTVSLFLWTWLRVRPEWTVTGSVAVGLTGALLPMVREQDLFFLAGPAIDFLRCRLAAPAGALRPASRARTRTGATLAAAVAGLVTFLLAYSPQLFAYTALNGHPSPTTAVGNKMTWSSPHFAGVLASPEHGLIVWTPLVVLSIAGLAWLAAGRVASAAADARWIGGLAVLMVLLQVYVSGSVESWTVAGAFGQRRFVALTPLLVLGLATLLTAASATRTARTVLAVLIALCIWWNVGLMAQFGLHIMDRQRLAPVDNARVTFLELPRTLPALVWRYVTDRESFFGLPRR
jgi:hypothetical protein